MVRGLELGTLLYILFSSVQIIVFPRTFLYTGDNPDWKEYVARMTDRWKRHICGWLINGYNNPLLIVKYENLKANVSLEMSRIIKFYGMNMSQQYLDSQVQAGYSRFYRNHTDSFQHYLPEQEDDISKAVSDTVSTLREHYSDNSTIIQILNSYV